MFYNSEGLIFYKNEIKSESRNGFLKKKFDGSPSLKVFNSKYS